MVLETHPDHWTSNVIGTAIVITTDANITKVGGIGATAYGSPLSLRSLRLLGLLRPSIPGVTSPGFGLVPLGIPEIGKGNITLSIPGSRGASEPTHTFIVSA